MALSASTSSYTGQEKVYLAQPTDGTEWRVVHVAAPHTSEETLVRQAQQLRTCPPTGHYYQILTLAEVRRNYPNAWRRWEQFWERSGQQIGTAALRWEQRRNPPPALAEMRASNYRTMRVLSRMQKACQDVADALAAIYDQESLEYQRGRLRSLAEQAYNEGMPPTVVVIYSQAARELEDLTF